MAKTIEITVSPKGAAKIETKGFSGTGCLDATRALEAALGAKTDESLTGEYYAEVNVNQVDANN